MNILLLGSCASNNGHTTEEASQWQVKVQDDGKFLFVDEDGDQMLDTLYDFARPFSHGFAVVRLGKCFLIDPHGKRISAAYYDILGKYGQSARVDPHAYPASLTLGANLDTVVTSSVIAIRDSLIGSLPGEYCLLDSTGKQVTAYFAGIDAFDKINRFRVWARCDTCPEKFLQALFGPDGRQYSPWYVGLSYSWENGPAHLVATVNDHGRQGDQMISSNGDTLSALHDYISPYRDREHGCALFRPLRNKNPKSHFGLLNAMGREVLPPNYDYIDYSDEKQWVFAMVGHHSQDRSKISTSVEYFNKALQPLNFDPNTSYIVPSGPLVGIMTGSSHYAFYQMENDTLHKVTRDFVAELDLAHGDRSLIDEGQFGLARIKVGDRYGFLRLYDGWELISPVYDTADMYFAGNPPRCKVKLKGEVFYIGVNGMRGE